MTLTEDERKAQDEDIKKAAEYMGDIREQIEKAQQMTKSDRLNMDILEDSVFKYLQAKRHVLENGIILYNSQGTCIENPANHIAQVALAKVMEICTQYGLTPLSRKKLAVEGSEDSPIDALINAANMIKNIAPPSQTPNKRSRSKKSRK